MEITKIKPSQSSGEMNESLKSCHHDKESEASNTDALKALTSMKVELSNAQKKVKLLKGALEASRHYNMNMNDVANDYRKLIASHENLIGSHRELKAKYLEVLKEVHYLLTEHRTTRIELESLRSTIAWLSEKNSRADSVIFSGKENMSHSLHHKRTIARPAFFGCD